MRYAVWYTPEPRVCDRPAVLPTSDDKFISMWKPGNVNSHIHELTKFPLTTYSVIVGPTSGCLRKHTSLQHHFRWTPLSGCSFAWAVLRRCQHLVYTVSCGVMKNLRWNGKSSEESIFQEVLTKNAKIFSQDIVIGGVPREIWTENLTNTKYCCICLIYRYTHLPGHTEDM
jgi:hypothetical protein